MPWVRQDGSVATSTEVAAAMPPEIVERVGRNVAALVREDVERVAEAS